MSPVALVHTEERKQLAKLAPVDAQAKLIEMWLYGKSQRSQEAYRLYITKFLAFVAKPIPKITLEDLYDFAGHLDGLGLAPVTQKILPLICQVAAIVCSENRHDSCECRCSHEFE